MTIKILSFRAAGSLWAAVVAQGLRWCNTPLPAVGAHAEAELGATATYPCHANAHACVALHLSPTYPAPDPPRTHSTGP